MKAMPDDCCYCDDDNMCEPCATALVLERSGRAQQVLDLRPVLSIEEAVKQHFTLTRLTRAGFAASSFEGRVTSIAGMGLGTVRIDREPVYSTTLNHWLVDPKAAF